MRKYTFCDITFETKLIEVHYMETCNEEGRQKYIAAKGEINENVYKNYNRNVLTIVQKYLNKKKGIMGNNMFTNIYNAHIHLNINLVYPYFKCELPLFISRKKQKERKYLWNGYYILLRYLVGKIRTLPMTNIFVPDIQSWTCNNYHFVVFTLQKIHDLKLVQEIYKGYTKALQNASKNIENKLTHWYENTDNDICEKLVTSQNEEACDSYYHKIQENDDLMLQDRGGNVLQEMEYGKNDEEKNWYDGLMIEYAEENLKYFFNVKMEDYENMYLTHSKIRIM